MTGHEHRRRRRQSDGPRRSTRRQGYTDSRKAVPGLADRLPLHQKRPILQRPARLPRPLELAWSHVGMTDKQRVAALGPGDLAQLIRSPGRIHRRDQFVAVMDIDPVFRKRQQVGLLDTELERHQPATPPRIGRIRHPRPTRDPAGRMDQQIAQAECAVVISAKIAPPQQQAGNLSAGEVGREDADAGHQARASISVKSSNPS